MLEYFSSGVRDYATQPILPYARPRWEFQVVLRGPLQVHLENTQQAPKFKRLWVFPAGVTHGWAGIAGKPCEILVMHFSRVPDVLRQAITPQLYLETALTPRDLRRLHHLKNIVEPHFRRPNRQSRLVSEYALLELTLLALRDIPESDLSLPLEPYACQKAQQALAWYEERLSSNPSVGEVAQAVSVSSVHLRRLFSAAGLAPPRTHFDQIRLDRADHLLKTTSLKLSTIAYEVGYSGPEAFQRAYRRSRGFPPGRMRKSI